MTAFEPHIKPLQLLDVSDQELSSFFKNHPKLAGRAVRQLHFLKPSITAPNPTREQRIQSIRSLFETSIQNLDPAKQEKLKQYLYPRIKPSKLLKMEDNALITLFRAYPDLCGRAVRRFDLIENWCTPDSQQIRINAIRELYVNALFDLNHDQCKKALHYHIPLTLKYGSPHQRNLLQEWQPRLYWIYSGLSIDPYLWWNHLTRPGEYLNEISVNLTCTLMYDKCFQWIIDSYPSLFKNREFDSCYIKRPFNWTSVNSAAPQFVSTLIVKAYSHVKKHPHNLSNGVFTHLLKILPQTTLDTKYNGKPLWWDLFCKDNPLIECDEIQEAFIDNLEAKRHLNQKRSLVKELFDQTSFSRFSDLLFSKAHLIYGLESLCRENSAFIQNAFEWHMEQIDHQRDSRQHIEDLMKLATKYLPHFRKFLDKKEPHLLLLCSKNPELAIRLHVWVKRYKAHHPEAMSEPLFDSLLANMKLSGIQFPKAKKFKKWLAESLEGVATYAANNNTRTPALIDLTLSIERPDIQKCIEKYPPCRVAIKTALDKLMPSVKTSMRSMDDSDPGEPLRSSSK